MKRGDMPAGPIGEQIDAWHMREVCNGMTIRERVAMAALQGLLANSQNIGSSELHAATAFNMADAWLAENEKRGE